MSRLRWTVLAAICIAVAASFIPAYSWFVRMRAESLIRDVSNLYQHPVKATTIGAVQAVFHGKLKQGKFCSPKYCEYEVVASNRRLATLHWAPYAELRIRIEFENGIMYGTFLDFSSSANQHHSIVSHVYIQEAKGPDFNLDPWEESSPIDTNGIVGVSPDSLRAHEQTVLGFDLTCLTSHRGCTTIAELLPMVWERAKDSSIRCLITNHKGLIEGPKWLWDAL
jgi:hypothetical protein